MPGSLGFDVKAGGKLDRLSDAVVTGAGTLMLVGNILKAEYAGKQNGVVVKISAKVDRITDKLINGSRKNDSDVDGAWFANKN